MIKAKSVLGKLRPDPKIQTKPSPSDWVAKGTRFPASTEFWANYKGQLRTGRVEGDALIVNGERRDAPPLNRCSSYHGQRRKWLAILGIPFSR